jgi:hypothetical protein
MEATPRAAAPTTVVTGRTAETPRRSIGWQSLRDIKPHSHFVRDLNSTALPEALSMTSVYTCRHEFFVPDDTARLDGAVNVEFCDRRLHQFDTFTDPVVYTRISAALDGWGAAACVEF